MQDDREIITASELAEWVYSPDEWLKRRRGEAQADPGLFDAGNRFHAWKRAVERIAGGSISAGKVLVVLGILALMAAVLWR